MITITKAQRQRFREQGYLIIQDVFSAKRIQSLVDAVEGWLDKALAGKLTKPVKWTDRERRIPALVHNMLCPDEYDPAFGEWFDTDIIPTVEALFDAPTRCSWLTMLASGGGHHYSTIWHRDYCHVDNPAETPVLERDLLRQCSFHAPLLTGDRFLQVIPGSHVRPATEAEAEAYRDNPHSDMPGQRSIELEPGDLMFRHGNILHRGWNPEGILRRTLFAGFWREGAPVWWEDCDDRETMLTPGHLNGLPSRVQTCIQRYLDAFPEGEPKSAKEI